MVGRECQGFLFRSDEAGQSRQSAEPNGRISVQARIKSVSILEEGQALVRYDLVQRDDNSGESRPAPYLSIIRYRFRDRPLAESDRFINPLGFEVIRYRKDPEAALPAAEAAPRQASLPSRPVVAGSEMSQ